MPEISIAPLGDSVAKMQARLADVQKLMGRTAPQAVSWASQLFCRSAAAVAKPGESKREVRPDPATNGKSYIVVVRRQPPAGPMFVKTRDKRDPIIKIERRGLSRSVWRTLTGMAAMFKPTGTAGSKRGAKDVFDSMPGTAKGRFRRRRLHAVYSMFFNENVSEAKILNELSYQREAYPSLESTAMQRAERALAWRLDQALGVVK